VITSSSSSASTLPQAQYTKPIDTNKYSDNKYLYDDDEDLLYSDDDDNNIDYDD